MTDDTLAEPAASTPRSALQVRLKARDLIDVGIFAVLYIVVVFAIAMVGIVSPLVMLLTLPLAPIVAGIPFMLFLSRVRGAGMITLLGVVVGLVMFAMGHPWQSLLVTVLCGVAAEAVLLAGRYRSAWAAVWAYTVFTVWFVGPWIPFFLDREAYVEQYVGDDMGSSYAANFADVVTGPAILAACAVTIVCGFLGGLLGRATVGKHFRRAGLA